MFFLHFKMPDVGTDGDSRLAVWRPYTSRGSIRRKTDRLHVSAPISFSLCSLFFFRSFFLSPSLGSLEYRMLTTALRSLFLIPGKPLSPEENARFLVAMTEASPVPKKESSQDTSRPHRTPCIDQTWSGIRACVEVHVSTKNKSFWMSLLSLFLLLTTRRPSLPSSTLICRCSCTGWVWFVSFFLFSYRDGRGVDRVSSTQSVLAFFSQGLL